MKLSVKTAVFLAVYFITAQAVFAQITVDLDVLTEDFIPKETIILSSEGEEKKEQATPLTAPTDRERITTNQKQQAVKKPVLKKATPPKKPKKPVVKKTSPKSTEKYRVKETAKKDEHDRLKPRANPVPKVKIIAADNNVKPAEETIEPQETVSDILTEPKISKHFLEQERMKRQKQKKEEEEKKDEEKINSLPMTSPQSEEPKSVEAIDPAVIKDTATKSDFFAPKTLLSGKPEPKAKKQTVSQPVKFSVFYVSGKLTPAERSALLSKEIPENSATRKAVEQKAELIQIFVFEKKSSHLTDEMQTALDSVAQLLKKNKNKRLLLYSYSGADPAEPGKERQYALRRALMIRSYLTQKGIHSLRIEMRSFGQKGAGSKMPDRTDILVEDK